MVKDINDLDKPHARRADECSAYFLKFIARCGGERTKVMVVAAMHGFHKNHPFYDYETLYKLVSDFKPDFVGVEIRPEDINADVAYLKKYYPSEMIELAQQYGSDHRFGFDWLGEAIEGQPIPEDYFKDGNRYVELLRAVSSDALIQERKPAELDDLRSKQEDILKNVTSASLHDSRYGTITRRIDALEKGLYLDSKYSYIVEFNESRVRKIDSVINVWIAANPGKRVVAIVGADHHTYAVENIRKYFGDKIELVPVE